MDFWKNILIETFEGKKKKILDLTTEEMMYEKVKCALDSVYTIETYFYIFDQTRNNNKGEIVPFKLFPFQKDLVWSYENNRFNITNKYRQAGISTVTCAWLATYVAFNQNRSVAVVANKLETARDELLKDITGFIDMLPPFLHPEISDKDAANHKIYKNGSQVKAFATNSLRGYTPTFLFWDEVAWCDKGEDFWTGTLPTLSTGGSAALVSCVTKDTAIWTENGLCTINDMIDASKKGSYGVEDYYVLGRKQRRYGRIIKNNGYCDTIKLKTELVSLEGSKSHKLWTYNNTVGYIGYMDLEKIKTNDYVAIQYGVKQFGNFNTIHYIPYDSKDKYFDYKITDKFGAFLGLFYNKGILNVKFKKGIPVPTINFTNLNEFDFNIINDFFNEFDEQYPFNKINYKKIKRDADSLLIESKSISYLLYFIDLDFDPKTDRFTNRYLTSFIKRFEGSSLFSFVKYYIATSNNNIIKEENSFKVKMNTIEFAKNLQQILLNYGIICSFDDEINIEKLRLAKERYLDIYLDYDTFMSSNDFDLRLFDQILPFGIIHHFRNELEKYGIDIPLASYSRFQLIDILEKVKDIISKESYDKIERFIANDLYWTIVEKNTKNKNFTYDFSLPKNENDFWAHSVIYNGILGHQTPNGLDPVFYKTYDNAKKGTGEFVANELHWYYDPRYANELLWKKKDENGVEQQIRELDKDKYKNLIADGWKPWSPWFESMASKFNYDKKRIAQELECVVGDTIITVKNIVNNKVKRVKIKDLSKEFITNHYQVLNDRNEFVSFDGVLKKKVNSTIKIKTKSGKEVQTTPNHLLVGNLGNILVDNLKINDKILTINGFDTITDIETINDDIFVYDLVNVDKGSLYLTNGIVSHNCSFLGSGNNFIDEEHIRRIQETQVENPIRMEYDDFFWIWEDPKKDKSYVMVVDVSTGAGDDYSTIIILKQHETHLEQVAEFKHKVSPDTLGVIANDYGRRYNNAFAIVDITGGIGAMTVKQMLEMGYTNMHYTNSRHEPTKEKLTDYIKEDENGKTLVPGFVISASNRGMVLTEMKRAIEANEVVIKSYRMVSEFKTFLSTSNNRVADHRRSFNDDLIIALAMGIYVFSYDIRSVGMSIERTKGMLNAITTTVNNYSSGDETTNGTQIVNPSNPYVANSWLFRGLKGFR